MASWGYHAFDLLSGNGIICFYACFSSGVFCAYALPFYVFCAFFHLAYKISFAREKDYLTFFFTSLTNVLEGLNAGM